MLQITKRKFQYSIASLELHFLFSFQGYWQQEVGSYFENVYVFVCYKYWNIKKI